jgi:hypothetical protein
MVIEENDTLVSEMDRERAKVIEIQDNDWVRLKVENDYVTGAFKHEIENQIEEGILYIEE